MCVGEASACEILVRSKAGEIVDVPSSWRLVASIESDARSVQPPVERVGHGRYRCEYVAPTAGRREVHIRLNDAPIGGSPFVVDAGAYHADPSQCVATGEGLSCAVACDRASFVVECFDRLGHALHPAAHPAINVAVSGASRDTDVCHRGGGVFSCSYAIREATDCEVAVTLGTEHIRGSPFRVKGLRGRPDASKSGVSVVPAGVILCGQRVQFFVLLRDAAGNYADASNLQLNVVDSHSTDEIALVPSPSAERAGYLEAVFAPTRVAQYVLTATVGGKALEGSPLAMSVVPEQADGLSTTLEGLVRRATVGEAIRFLVSIRSVSGAATRPTRLDGSVKVDGAGPVAISFVGKAHSVGQFDGTFFARSVGVHTVEISVDGQPIRGSPFEIEVRSVSVSVVFLPFFGFGRVRTV
jgi:hypothetical protein